MKAPALEQVSEESDALTLESCEDGLDFLAYVIREELAEGRPERRVDLEETRSIATELLAHAIKSLAERWDSSSVSGPDALLEPRLLRLLGAIRGALHPSTSRKQLAEALQSVADLIRSTRQFERPRAMPLFN
jgi:hypothetical protein